jgi:HEAT repeat protein
MIELAAALQSELAAMRWQALVRFNQDASKSADPATLSMLTGALADGHPFVRWQAGMALASEASGRQKLVELVKNYPALPPEFTPVRAEFKTDLMYAAAIDALVDQKSVEAQAYLAKPLAQGDPMVRQSAAEVLGRQGQTEAMPHLLAALKDSDPWVRRAAILGLGHLGDARAAGELIGCLKDRAVVVRRSASYVLGALRAAAALPALEISLTDADPQVRRNAAWALGRIGQAEAVAALTRLLDDPELEGEVAAAAKEAIAALSKPGWQKLVLGLGQRLQR